MRNNCFSFPPQNSQTHPHTAILSGGNHVCVFFGWSNFSGFSGWLKVDMFVDQLGPSWVNSACLWSALVSGWFFACLVGGDWNIGEMYGIMMVNDG